MLWAEVAREKLIKKYGYKIGYCVGYCRGYWKGYIEGLRARRLTIKDVE